MARKKLSKGTTTVETRVEVGMTVVYRGCWGAAAPKQVVIESITLCEEEGDKYGESVDSVDASDLNRCTLGLDDEHWCYGYQVEKVLGFVKDTDKPAK